MKRSARRVFSLGILGAAAFGAAAAFMPAAPATAGGTVSCGPCSDAYFNKYGQICFLYSCNGGPCIWELCLDFGGGGGGGGGGDS